MKSVLMSGNLSLGLCLFPVRVRKFGMIDVSEGPLDFIGDFYRCQAFFQAIEIRSSFGLSVPRQSGILFYRRNDPL